MNLFIPVTRFKVQYEIGIGKPYSELYSLVLKAIGTGEACSEQDLSALFKIPQRLIIEILVGLSKVGLLGVETATTPRLVATPLGKKAMSEGGLLEYLRLQERREILLMECVTGGVALSKGIRCESMKKFDEKKVWNKRLCVPNSFTDPRIDEGQISHLIRIRPNDKSNENEYVRWIGTPEMISRNHLWLLVDADIDRGRVFNLPEEWRARLEPVLIEFAAELRGRVSSEILSISEIGNQSRPADDEKPITLLDSLQETMWPVRLNERDILIGTEQHVSVLKSALETAAKSVVIVSSEIDPTFLEASIARNLREALSRGVQVDVLWGGASKNANVSVTKWLGDLRKAGLNRTTGLRFNSSPSGWNANVLAYDTADDEYHAVVGSFKWLAGDSSPSMEISLQVHEPGVVADVLRSVAGIWKSAPRNALSGVPDKWRQLSTVLEEKATHQPERGEAQDEFSCKVAVIRDQNHPVLLRNCISTAQLRVGIRSASFGPAGAQISKALCHRQAANPVDANISYGELDGIAESDLIEVSENVREGGTSFNQMKRCGNLMVADLTALITSYGLLGSKKRSKTGDLGLLIEGGLLPDALWDGIFKE